MAGVLLLFAALVAVPAIWATITHNRLTAYQNLVAESWRQVDVELRRRYDLIPNLVRTVQAQAAYERSTLDALVAARARAMDARDLARRASGEDGLDRAVRSALAQLEAYPELRASQQFVALQRELVDTEDRIAAGRRFYNGNVRTLNTALASFPSSLIGSAMGVRPGQYFEAADPARLAPPVLPGGQVGRGSAPRP